MSKTLAITLGQKLDREVRQHFTRTYESMWRELDYGIEHAKPGIGRAISNGWSADRLRALAVLNAFARTVLGPLAAAMDRKQGCALGISIPIQYGKVITIDAKTGAPVRAAIEAFEKLCVLRQIRARWLHASRINEVVYLINRQYDGDHDAER